MVGVSFDEAGGRETEGIKHRLKQGVLKNQITTEETNELELPHFTALHR